MKKYLKPFILLLSLTVLLILSGCGSTKTETQKVKGNDKRVLDAIEIISGCWNENYTNSKLNIEDKYLEITNTKIVNIKPNDISLFKNIDYIVEFSLESNFYNSAPYYSNIGSRDSFVAVYTDGNCEVLGTNPFHSYIRQNGPTDFEDIIESIDNYHGEYDQVLELN